jgi:hypothetical protein
MSGILLLSILWFNVQVTYGYIKITFPNIGQNVPLGNIVILGTSASNTTLHCTVAVVLNGIQPYKNVVPRGQHEGGANGYSNWTYTTAITKPGLNRITAKFSCPPTLHLTKFYSVNVTGVETSSATQKQAGTLANSTTFRGVPVLFPGTGNVK